MASITSMALTTKPTARWLRCRRWSFSSPSRRPACGSPSQIGIDRLPEQAHQQVAAALGAEARLDQLDGQFPAQPDVVRVEQAVVGDAQRLRQELGTRRASGSGWLRGRPDFRKRGQDRRVRAVEVVRLPGQPGADAQREHRARVQQREHVLEPRLEQDRAGHGAPLAYPQSGQAQRGRGHGLHVTGLFGEPVGALVTRRLASRSPSAYWARAPSASAAASSSA